MNHINTKVLLGLAVVAGLAAGGATLVSLFRQPQQEDAVSANYALPALREHINDIKAITLTGAEEKVLVSIENQEQGWIVSEKAGYPADSGKIRSLLLNFADARLLEAKTANPDRYAEIGVEDVKAKDAKSVLLKISNLPSPSQLIVGNSSTHGNGTYVRRPDEQQSWLAQGRLDVNRDPGYWLDNALIDVSLGRIAGIEVKNPDTPALHLLKQNIADPNFQLAATSPAKDLPPPDKLSTLSATLKGLSLLDVGFKQSITAPAEDRQIKASFKTFDGLTVEMSAWQQDNKYYADFKVAQNGEAAKKAVQAELDKAKSDYEAKQKAEQAAKAVKDGNQEAESGSSQPVLTPAPAAVVEPDKYRQDRLAALDAEFKLLNSRFQGRYFVIPSYKYNNLENLFKK